jgi:Leucine-rich repeat (LRR) protein
LIGEINLFDLKKHSVQMVAAWPQLYSLDMGFNEIKKLPPVISQMKLTALVVEGNPLLVPSRAIASKGTKSILDYLASRVGAAV